jgi:hypothetical protein
MHYTIFKFKEYRYENDDLNRYKIDWVIIELNNY